MFRLEVLPERLIRRVILVEPIGIAEMTEQVIPSQMPEEIVTVHVSRVTKLTQRMSLVRRVVRIPFSSMLCQIRPRITFTFPRKDT